jgi:hypothetical protein
MDLLTSHAATIALVAGVLVLLLGVAWALRAPHAPGRRFVPRTRTERVVSAILLLDGCVLLALGAVWLLGAAGDAERDGPPAAARAPSAPDAAPPAAPEPGTSAEPGASEEPGTSEEPNTPATPGAPAEPGASAEPGAPAESAAPAGSRRSRGFLVARLTGDGASPGRGDRGGRGGVRLDVRPGRRLLCFDMAVDRGVRGSIAQANVYREADGEGARPHLTLVVPDDKEARRRRGCAYRPPTDALQAVLDAPGDFHVTIFTAAHPDGAVRGTLRTCPRPCTSRAPDLLR